MSSDHGMLVELGVGSAVEFGESGASVEFGPKVVFGTVEFGPSPKLRKQPASGISAITASSTIGDQFDRRIMTSRRGV